MQVVDNQVLIVFTQGSLTQFPSSECTSLLKYTVDVKIEICFF